MDIDSNSNAPTTQSVNIKSTNVPLPPVVKLNTEERKFIATTLTELCEQSHGTEDDAELRKVLCQEFEEEYKKIITPSLLAREIRNIKDSNKKIKEAEKKYEIQQQVYEDQIDQLTTKINNTQLEAKKRH